MKTLAYIAFLSIIASCYSNVYPEEKFAIDSDYRNLIAPYNLGDTLVFKSNRSNLDSFLISSIDSILDNTKGGLMSKRPSKFIVVRYRQIPIDYWSSSRIEMGSNNENRKEVKEDGWLLSIQKYPDDNSTWFHFTFKTRNHCFKEQIELALKDTIFNDTLKIANYYKIKYCPEKITDSASIETVYSSVQRGIVAYTSHNGEQWTRTR